MIFTKFLDKTHCFCAFVMGRLYNLKWFTFLIMALELSCRNHLNESSRAFKDLIMNSQICRVIHAQNYVGPVGIEPTTHGLKVRCSTD